MENNSDGLSSYLIENNSIFVKTIYFQILLTAEKQDMNRRHKRSEKQEGSYPRHPASILELDTLYVNLAVKWSFAWPKSIVPTFPLTLDVTISALLTRLRFTPKHSTLCFTPPPRSIALYFERFFEHSTLGFASQRSFLRKTNESWLWLPIHLSCSLVKVRQPSPVLSLSTSSISFPVELRTP